jgi:hypothetical protein
LEKCKAQPQTRKSDAVFYQYAWWYHFKHVGPVLLKDADKLFITAAALGSNKTRAAFKNALNNAIQQIIPRKKWECSFLDSAKEPLLWAADYCAWEVELNDSRSHSLNSSKDQYRIRALANRDANLLLKKERDPQVLAIL